jgi:hypothetical protein
MMKDAPNGQPSRHAPRLPDKEFVVHPFRKNGSRTRIPFTPARPAAWAPVKGSGGSTADGILITAPICRCKRTRGASKGEIACAAGSDNPRFAST